MGGLEQLESMTSSPSAIDLPSGCVKKSNRGIGRRDCLLMTPGMSPERDSRPSTAHPHSHSCPWAISDERSLGSGRNGKLEEKKGGGKWRLHFPSFAKQGPLK